MLKIMPFITFMCIFIITSLSFAGVKINPEKVYEAGVKAFESAKYKKAIGLFEKAIETGLRSEKLKDSYLKLYYSAILVDNQNNIKDYEAKCKRFVSGFKSIKIPKLYKFFYKYKSAVIERNFEKIRNLAHPSYLSCVNENEMYQLMITYSDLFSKNTGIEKISIEDISKEAFDKKPKQLEGWEFSIFPKQMIQVSYNFSDGSGGGVNIFVALHNGEWKWVWLCKQKNRNRSSKEGD